MKARDLILPAAVLMIAGVAVADSLRGDSPGQARPARDAPGSQTTQPTPVLRAQPGWPKGLLSGTLATKREDLLLGTTAVWSPDGEWIAVADGRNNVQIRFVRVVAGDDVLRWDAGAVELLWRGPRLS
jgi:hypothetical protein